MIASALSHDAGLRPIFDLARLQPLGHELVRRYRQWLEPMVRRPADPADAETVATAAPRRAAPEPTRRSVARSPDPWSVPPPHPAPPRP